MSVSATRVVNESRWTIVFHLGSQDNKLSEQRQRSTPIEIFLAIATSSLHLARSGARRMQRRWLMSKAVWYHRIRETIYLFSIQILRPNKITFWYHLNVLRKGTLLQAALMRVSQETTPTWWAMSRLQTKLQQFQTESSRIAQPVS